MSFVPDSAFIKYGTLFVSLLSVGFIGGVWGCNLFGNPTVDNCGSYYTPGMYLSLIFAALTLTGVMTIRQQFKDRTMYAYGLPILALITLMATSGLWGCQSCFSAASTVASSTTTTATLPGQNAAFYWTAFIFSLITFLGLLPVVIFKSS